MPCFGSLHFHPELSNFSRYARFEYGDGFKFSYHNLGYPVIEPSIFWILDFKEKIVFFVIIKPLLGYRPSYASRITNLNLNIGQMHGWVDQKGKSDSLRVHIIFCI
jgi:hypothetical protein